MTRSETATHMPAWQWQPDGSPAEHCERYDRPIPGQWERRIRHVPIDPAALQDPWWQGDQA